MGSVVILVSGVECRYPQQQTQAPVISAKVASSRPRSCKLCRSACGLRPLFPDGSKPTNAIPIGGPKATLFNLLTRSGPNVIAIARLCAPSAAPNMRNFSFGFSALQVACSLGRRRLWVSHARTAHASCPVMFEQHPSENCNSDCSKCLFVVASRNICANVRVRRRGASPGRSFRSIRCPGDKGGAGKIGQERGA